MSVTTQDRPTDIDLTAELGEAVGEAALSSLLHRKPDGEPIPTSVWWLVAECLRASVALRRQLVNGPAVGDQPASGLLAEAVLLSDLALVELADATEARPALVAVGDEPPPAVVALQISALRLTRLLVSRFATDPGRLADALAAHVRALHRCWS